MRNFQIATLDSLSGGLTDNYKEASLMFRSYKNFIPTDNSSAKLRRGCVPYCNTLGLSGAYKDVNCITTLRTLADYYLVANVGKSIMYKSSDKFRVLELDGEEASFPNMTNDNIASMLNWRDSIIVNPETNDDPVSVIVDNATGDVKSFISSLPEVVSTSLGAGAGDRLYAVCIVRTYVSANGYTFNDYSPEYLGRTGDTTSITTVEPALDPAYGDDLKYALFVSLPNKSSLYLAETSTDGTFNYTADDETLPVSEAGFFLSEEIKIQIPSNKYMFKVGNTFYYTNITTSTGENRGNRVYQAVQGMPTSVLASGYTDFDNEVFGGGAVNGVPVVLTQSNVYRIDGTLGVDGSGTIRKQVIAGANGGISHQSFVTTERFGYYAGTDGFYQTDGYTATNISGSRLYKTYSNLIKDRNQWKNIQGSFDRDNNFIYWKINKTTVYVYNITTGTFGELEYPTGLKYIHVTSDENKKHISTITTKYDEDVLNKKVRFIVDSARSYNIDADVSILDTDDVTIYSGEVTNIDTNTVPDQTIVEVQFVDFIGLPSDFDGFEMYLDGDETINRTYFCMEDSLVKYSDSDVRFDSSEADTDTDTNYERTPIDFDFLTAGISYMSKDKKKWVKSLTINIQADTALAMTPYVIVDDNGDVADMAYVDNKNQFSAFDDSDIAGRESLSWFPDTMVRTTRHLPRGYNYCWNNQIGIKASPITLLDSIEYQTATIMSFDDSGDFPVAVIKIDEKDGFQIRFPRDVINNTISVKGGGNNDFSTEVKIQSINASRTDLEIIANSYVSSLAIGDTIDWIIYGMPVSQSFEITSMAINYAITSDYGAGANRTDSSESKYGG